MKLSVRLAVKTYSERKKIETRDINLKTIPAIGELANFVNCIANGMTRVLTIPKVKGIPSHQMVRREFGSVRPYDLSGEV